MNDATLCNVILCELPIKISRSGKATLQLYFSSSGLYLFGTKEGLLERLYPRNEFTTVTIASSRHMMCPQVHYLFSQSQ